MLADRLGGDALAAVAEPVKTPAKVKAKSVIQIFLWGGMSHNDTWDPKPDVGPRIHGRVLQGDPHQRGRDPNRRPVSRSGKTGRQVLAHPQHDPPQQRP